MFGQFEIYGFWRPCRAGRDEMRVRPKIHEPRLAFGFGFLWLNP